LQGNTPEARALAEQLRSSLGQLRDLLNTMLTDKAVDDFADISTPLKAFVDAAQAPIGAPNRDANFADRSRALTEHSDRCAATGRMVATAGPCKNKKTVEALQATATQVQNMTPQVCSPSNLATDFW